MQLGNTAFPTKRHANASMVARVRFVTDLIQNPADSDLRTIAPEHAFDRTPMRRGEGDVGEFGEEKPLLSSLESSWRGEVENRERHTMMREGIGEKGERFGDGGLLRERG